LRRRGLLAAALLLCAARALADGGRVRLRQDAGPFAITVFTAPDPLTVGPADVSVLVQNREDGAVLLDAGVEVRLTGPGAATARSYPAGPGANRLMKAAAVGFPTAGTWRLEVIVHRASEASMVSGTCAVEPAASRLEAIWPFLAVPPLAVALFALREARFRRRGRQG
jgi:hypothetical protein